MSSGLECQFVEVRPGEWFYLLERGSAPKQSWDWREYADAYGPFSTEDLAHEHLRDNHQNPGGYSVTSYVEGYQPDEVMARLVTEATPADYFYRY